MRIIISILFLSSFAFACQQSEHTLSWLKYYANEYQIDQNLIIAIAQAESSFCLDAVSYTEDKKPIAYGVMQLTPGTAKMLGVNHLNPNENIKGGVQYFSMQLARFGDIKLALAAYNAGPENVRKYQGVPPFQETIKYIINVHKFYNALNKN